MVGSHLADFLLQNNTDWDIYGMCLWRSALDNVQHLLERANRKDRLYFISADLNDYICLQNAVEESKPDYVFHLVAQSYPTTSFTSPIQALETNIREMVEAYFRNGRQWDMEVLYSRDPIPLGTAGAVRYTLNQVHSDRFLVMNGDSYCRVDISRLEEAHIARTACASLWLLSVDDCSRYGSVEIGEDGAVQAFHEKPPEKRAGLINAGVYLLEREAAETIPEGRAVSIETEFFPRLIGHGLYAVVGEGPFLDIGTPEAYNKAPQFFASETLA